MAIVGQRLFLGIGERAEHAAEAGAAAKQAGRLAGGQIQHVLLAQIHPPQAGELQQFALNHVLGELDEDVQDAEIAFLEGHLERLHVEPIPGQDAAMVSPARVGRRPAAARIGAVDHVVMDEGGAVDQLDDGAQAHGGGALVTRISGRQQEQGGAQALASSAEQVTGDFGHRLVRQAGLLRDLPFDAREVVAHQIKNLFNRQQ